MRRIALFLSLACAGCAPRASPSTPIVWAWERREDLRFLPAGTEVAVQTGFVELSGDRLVARGRRYPLLVDAPPATALVHVQIDPDRRLAWTPALRRRTAAAIVHFATRIPVRRVQVDFEVFRSQRPVLLDVLRDVRARLPAGTRLSMTALASWCDGERWIAAAPVDEIVPMLFRMGHGGAGLRARLAAGGDFRDPRCRTALGIATDTPIARAPPGRRVYMFAPRSWTAAMFDATRRQVEEWR